jgi:transcription antitermination factor NusG
LTAEAYSLRLKEATKDPDERLWYVAYTLPRHEKAVADRLSYQNLETYLPLYSSARLWNQRRVEVELPLFPGYVFVKLIHKERVRVLGRPGIIRFVGCNGKATPLPDGEVEQLRSSLAIWEAEPYPFLTPGKQVRIKSGPFAGLEGQIIRRKGKRRLVVSFELIQRAILVDIDAVDAQLVS